MNHRGGAYRLADRGQRRSTGFFRLHQRLPYVFKMFCIRAGPENGIRQRTSKGTFTPWSGRAPADGIFLQLPVHHPLFPDPGMPV